MKVGEITISQMDLNVEQGKVEFPEKPVVQFFTPIVDRKGVVQGIIIINLQAELVWLLILFYIQSL
ncbi:MAG: hypothetical protein KAI83_05135 [Thiomargarita sp.]|nr:hypothetical protein [Thiomargarita sp.]